MKFYTVWNGEYSDRILCAIFLSEAKAKKYAKVHDKLAGDYGDYYVTEYENEDDNFDINTEANKYYYCTIDVADSWNGDKSYQLTKKGEIETDEFWDDFMEEWHLKNYEDLNPKMYAKVAEENFWLVEQIIEDEEKNGGSVQWQACSKPTVVQYDKSSWTNEITSITVFARESYALARKIAIEQYQIFTQQQLEDGTLG